MKIKSLLLGSVAAAGLSTSAYAADLGTVLTSLDVCDSLNITGLTISSDTNCLQISGGVEYEFKWGDYNGTDVSYDLPAGTFTTPAADSVTVDDEEFDMDWESHVDAWLNFTGSADSSFGTAKAVIEFGYDEDYDVDNEGFTETDDKPANASLVIDEAYVAVGDTTVLMAGKKGSIANMDDDEPFNYLGLFNSEAVDTGVAFNGDLAGIDSDTSHAIQITSDLGNGVSVGAGLENLDGSYGESAEDDGTAVGVISYAGDGISAHATFLAGGILDGDVEDWGMHAGITGEFDMFKVRGAVAADNSGYWNALASAEATFDIFTIAGSVEAAHDDDDDMTYFGAGGSFSAAVTDGITINVGGRWADNDTDSDDGGIAQVEAQIVAALTETLTATAEAGWVGEHDADDEDTIYFGGELAWAPGGGFESSVAAEANDAGAYSVTFNASKDFE